MIFHKISSPWYASSFEDRQAIHSLAHTNCPGQHSSGSAKQSWQPALVYLQRLTINTVKRRTDSCGELAKLSVLGQTDAQNAYGRRRYSSLIIRPHQLAYGSVNLKLAKSQLRQTLRSKKKKKSTMGRVL